MPAGSWPRMRGRRPVADFGRLAVGVPPFSQATAAVADGPRDDRRRDAKAAGRFRLTWHRGPPVLEKLTFSRLRRQLRATRTTIWCNWSIGKVNGGITLPLVGKAALAELRQEINAGMHKLDRLARQAWPTTIWAMPSSLPAKRCGRTPTTPRPWRCGARWPKRRQLAAAGQPPAPASEAVPRRRPADGGPPAKRRPPPAEGDLNLVGEGPAGRGRELRATQSRRSPVGPSAGAKRAQRGPLADEHEPGLRQAAAARSVGTDPAGDGTLARGPRSVRAADPGGDCARRSGERWSSRKATVASKQPRRWPANARTPSGACSGTSRRCNN